MKLKITLTILGVTTLSLTSCKSIKVQNEDLDRIECYLFGDGNCNGNSSSSNSNGKNVVIVTEEVVKDGIKYTYSSDVLFATDSYTLSANSKDDLQKLVKILNKKKSKKIRIDGYTDSTGAVEYNNTLSVNRANSVKEFLVKEGVDASRMSTVGHGSKNPVADNSTPEGRQKNRRVEITILN